MFNAATTSTGHRLCDVRTAIGAVIAALLYLLVAGCGLLPEAHKIDVQQGNIIDDAALVELRSGMTKKQVLFLLGNPVIRDPFHPHRWDYVYYVIPAGAAPTPKRLTLYFDGDVLIRVLDRYTDHSVDTYVTGEDS